MFDPLECRSCKLGHCHRTPISNKAYVVVAAPSVSWKIRMVQCIVIRHGSRHKPCEGSDKPPLNIVGPATHRSSALGSVDPTAAATAFPSSNELDSVVVSSDVENAQDALVSDFVPVCVPLIKHIPKSARPACATHLKKLLDNVVSDCKVVSAWLAVLYWSTKYSYFAQTWGQEA